MKDPFGAGTTATPSLLPSHHLRPDEVTRQVREKMEHDIAIDHFVWSGFIALLTVIIGVGAALVDTVDHRSPDLLWHLGTIFAIGLWAELVCYLVFKTRKRFVRESPATAALVVRQRDLESFVNEVSARIPRVLLRYFPGKAEKSDPEELRVNRDAENVWAELDGLSPQFERNLHAGDIVTVLYDPKRPRKIKVVEMEDEGAIRVGPAEVVQFRRDATDDF